MLYGKQGRKAALWDGVDPGPALHTCRRRYDLGTLVPILERMPDGGIRSKAGQLLPAEPGLLLHQFQCVVNDRAVTGAVREVPHSGKKASIATNSMREVDAIVRTYLVHRTHVGFQENAPVLIPSQNQTFLFALLGKVAQERRRGDTEKPCEARYVPVDQSHRSDLAAIGALSAIHL